MEIKKHYFMTCAALFFLGLIVAKPGSTFYPASKEQERDCKLVKGKLDCEVRTVEYTINQPTIHYEFE